MAKRRPLYVKVTAKLARELAMKHFGTAKGLKKSESFHDRYEMCMGFLVIEFRPSYSEPGLVEIEVRIAPNGGWTYFYNPDTLESDFGADERETMRRRRSFLEDWVFSHSDPKYCKEEIDRIWNRP